ncbi:MAG: TraR/DksA family transcriptional regulator [Oceanococcus sp.]
MSLTTQQRKQLSERIKALQSELGPALLQAQESAQPVELDQTLQGRLSRMDAMQGQAMAQAASQRLQRQQQGLKRAAGNLEHVDFGLCTECDEPIAWARLQFDPAVRLCMSCAQAAEA